MNNITPQTDIAEELRIVIGRLVAELRWDSDDILRLIKREDLSMPRIAALGDEMQRGVASISEVSACLELSLANTSMLIDKLVCRGFVSRAEDASDRRQKQVRLTDKGSALIDEIRAARTQGIVERMLLLPPELLGRTIDVLGEVVAQLPDLNTHTE